MRLEELVDLHVEENILSQDTIKKYKSVVSIFIRDTGNNSIFIEHKTILSWRDNILNRSSAGNWNNYHRHMKALLQTATKFKLVKENPFKEVKAITHYPNKRHVLSDKEIKRLFSFCDNIEYGWFWYCVITTLYYTGIRRKQLVGLTWGDLDLKNKTLRLQASSSKTKREYTIPINREIINSILLIQEKTKNIYFYHQDERNNQVKSFYQDKDNQIFNIALIKPRFHTNRMNINHVLLFLKKPLNR